MLVLLPRLFVHKGIKSPATKKRSTASRFTSTSKINSSVKIMTHRPSIAPVRLSRRWESIGRRSAGGTADGTSKDATAMVCGIHPQRRGRRILGRRRRLRTITTTTPPNAPSEGQWLNLAPPTPEARREAFGERVYPLVHATQPVLAGKITGMFLHEMEDPELLHLIDSPEALDSMIQEALQVLGAVVSGGGS